MRSSWLRISALVILSWISMGIILGSDASKDKKPKTHKPEPLIYITQVSAKEQIIRGEVKNLPEPADQFVVYCLVRTDIIYPHPNDTTVGTIDSKGRWEIPHKPRGQERELLAVLVPRSFKMPVQVRVLEDLSGILAATGIRYQKEFKGQSQVKPRRINFANRIFRVRNETGGPGPNHFSDDEGNVFLKNGHLNLRITEHGKETHCAEVVLEEPLGLGFGQYTWVISGKFSRDHFDDRTVLGIFLYGNNDAEEIDALEIARWNKPDNFPAQFVLQPPPYTKKNLHRFEIGTAEVLTCSLVWSPGKAWARCWEGADRKKGRLLADWSSGPKVPTKGLKVHMNLWAYQGKPGPKTANTVVVIRDFQFEPLGRIKD